MFILESFLLGVALAMDAFSVSLANGLNDPGMKKTKILGIAGMFSFFQALMPFIGWICVKSVLTKFTVFEKFIPYIALALLGYLGGKMLYEGIKNGHCEKSGACEIKKLGLSALIVQGIATSIDALSAGLAFISYSLLETAVSVLVIAAVTFVICTAGVIIGKKFGTIIAGKANILGGVILIIIGLEIFIKGII